MHLYLIRPGESCANPGVPLAKEELDAGLTPLGHKQAAALADWLPGHLPEIDGIYASTMKRARVGLFLDEVIRVHAGKAVLAVAHGGTVNAVADAGFNVGAYRRCDIHAPNTAFSHFEYREPSDWETWRVYSIGLIDRLAGLDGSA